MKYPFLEIRFIGFVWEISVVLQIHEIFIHKKKINQDLLTLIHHPMIHVIVTWFEHWNLIFHMIYRKNFMEIRNLIVQRVFLIVIKSVKVCKDMTNNSYIWGYFHTITNHTIYICRGTTSTVYFIGKSKLYKTGLISRDN